MLIRYTHSSIDFLRKSRNGSLVYIIFIHPLFLEIIFRKLQQTFNYNINYRNTLAHSKLSFPKLFQFYAISSSKMPKGESSEMPIRWRRWKDASHSRESKKVKHPFKGKKQMHLAKIFFLVQCLNRLLKKRREKIFFVIKNKVFYIWLIHFEFKWIIQALHLYFYIFTFGLAFLIEVHRGIYIFTLKIFLHDQRISYHVSNTYIHTHYSILLLFIHFISNSCL